MLTEGEEDKFYSSIVDENSFTQMFEPQTTQANVSLLKTNKDIKNTDGYLLFRC